MAEGKNSFLLYKDIIHVIKKLPREIRGDLFTIILEYVNDENPIVDDLLLSVVFEPIKLQLKRDLIKYESKRGVSSENGTIGNLKRWHIDLYNSFINGEITLEQAVEIADGRKSSGGDTLQSGDVGFIAVSVTGSDSDSDTANDIVPVTEKEKVNTKKVRQQKSASPPNSIEKFKQIALESFNSTGCTFGTNFKKVWLEIIQESKWKKKTQSAINKSLKLLMAYDEEFSIALVNKCIAANYQGVVYDDTDEKYLKYLSRKNGTGQQSASSKEQSRAGLTDLAKSILASG